MCIIPVILKYGVHRYMPRGALDNMKIVN